MLAKKIAYNTIVSAASRLLGTALALVTVGLTTRYLGQNGFGDYSTILAFLYIFSILADLGIYSITLREISKSGAPEQEIVNQAFSLRFWSGLLIFGLAPAAAWFFPYSFQIKIGVAVGAIGFWFMSAGSVFTTIFQKYLKMEKVALAELAGRLVQLVLIIIVAAKNLGFFNIMLATSLSSAANFLVIFLFVRRRIPIRISWDFAYWRKMMKESFPLALSAIFVMIYFKLDTVMLSVMKSSGDVGIYSVAYKILESLIFFPAMFVGLLMPLLSKYVQTSLADFKKVAQKGLDFMLIFSVPLAGGGLLLSGPIIHLIAGANFSAAVGVLDILIFATAVIFFGSLFSNMIIAFGKQKALAKIYGLGAILNFSVNLFLIPRFSYWGAASSTLLTEAVVTFLMAVVIKKSINYLPNFALLSKVALAASAMVFVLWLLGDLNLFFLLIIGSLVYFAGLLGLRAFSMAELWALIGRERGQEAD